MFGNSYVTCLSLTGVITLALGTVMGLIGMATTDWFIFDAHHLATNTTFYETNFMDSAVVTGMEPINCRVGLFQMCCGLQSGLPDCTSTVRVVTSEMNTLRVLLVVSLIGMAVSVIALLLYIFKESCHSRHGNRVCVSLLIGVSVLIFLLVVMSATMVEYLDADGFFGPELDMASTTLGWSFIVALIGALINPLGLFFLCSQWHFTDDKDAGVKYDYDEKKIIHNNNAVDTYI